MERLQNDTIGLTYRPTKVIYKGKEFTAPVFLTTLQSWDLLVIVLKTNLKSKIK